LAVKDIFILLSDPRFDSQYQVLIVQGFLELLNRSLSIVKVGHSFTYSGLVSSICFSVSQC